MDATERVAVHEAGHAVVAVLLGRKEISARLLPRPETRMKPVEVPKGRPATGAERAAVEGELMLAVAGVAAERTLGIADATSLAGALDDLERATRLGLQLHGRARAEPTVQHFLSVTERMLRGRAEVLREVAAALREHGRLDAAALDALVPRR